MASLYRNGRLVTTAAVAVRDGRYFLARRKETGAQSLRWEFPGGKCDEDCDERGCLEREFLEEFGVSITVGREVGTVQFEHNDTRYVLVGYHVVIPEAILELREHVASGWFTPEEMVRLDLSDSDRRLLPKILTGFTQ